MISQQTVFVLGAGANVPYGFSTGGGLIDKIRGKDPRTLMGDAGLQITRLDSDAFRAAADENLLPSIDAMLEHRSDLLSVGKRVMATLLYKEEASAGPKAFEEDWMSLVFSSMAENAATLDAFAQNPVSFVTFNYDRYLEHRFMRGLAARYRVDGRAAWNKISGMFVHLYGTLGELPEQIPDGRDSSQVVPLGAPKTDNVYSLGLALPRAENAIRIVHDTDQPPAAFADAGKRFKTAQQVFFLGFGFGRKNVQRLQTNSIAATVAVHCTTYDMTLAEIFEFVIPAFPNHALDELRRHGSTGKKTIRLFLREHIKSLR